MITSNGETANTRSEGAMSTLSEGTIGTRSMGAVTTPHERITSTRRKRPIGIWIWSIPWVH
jgi:hypothetical protein